MAKYNVKKFGKLLDRILLNSKEKVEETSILLNDTMKNFLLNVEIDVLSNYFITYIKNNLTTNYSLEDILLLDQTAYLIGNKRLAQQTQILIFEYLLGPLRKKGLLSSHLLTYCHELKRNSLNKEMIANFVGTIKNERPFKQ
jgi:hypothetical protein